MINMTNMNRIIEIGSALSSEQDYNKLLDMILNEAMIASHADAGTIYIADDDGKLKFFILRNNSLNIYQGAKGENVSFPPVPMEEKFICAYSALHNCTIQVDDVYTDTRFDFSGSQNYDKMSGYTTRSMLAVPLHDNENNVIGVLQLLNATDDKGNLTSFDEGDIEVIQLLSSFSSVSISSMQHRWEMKRQMFSFFNVIISAVDARTPYNATHTERIVKMLISFIDYVRDNPSTQSIIGTMDENRAENMLIGAWLHDIGKLFTPLSIMNKATRLGEKNKAEITNRFERIQMLSKIHLLEREISISEYEKIIIDINKSKEEILRLNNAGFVTDEDVEIVKEIGNRKYKEWDGSIKNWLSPEEIECLSIAKGTLTADERKIMEQHASMTAYLLGRMKFSTAYDNAMKWAGSHHEKLDGTGYPKGLTGKDLPVEVRLLTILDILEALTTDERPYKKAMSPEKAFTILYEMAEDGQLDKDILSVVEKSRAWEHPSELEMFERDRAIDIVSKD